MMTDSKVELGLIARLERLPNEDPECGLSGYRELSRKVAHTPRFRAALARARAMADERRLTALALLRRRDELCACELQAALGVGHATISHHMTVLTKAGWVLGERRGKWMYYRLNPKSSAVIP
jgi:biotin operon repressor